MIYESMIIGIESAVFPEVQRASKALFGNQDRLVVAAAVAEAEPGSIYARSLAQEMGITDNRVSPQLHNLERAGLLTRLPKLGGGPTVHYERRDSAFWELCVSLCRELGA